MCFRCCFKEVKEIVFETCQEFLSSGIEGNFSQFVEACPVVSSVAGGIIIGTLIALGIIVAFFLLAGLYVYTSLAWYAIAKKLKYKAAWLAWIPIVRIVMVLELGKFHWAWILLIFVPVLGWAALFVLFIIALWRVFVKTNNPGWFSLALIIPEIGGLLYLIFIGIAGWGGKKNKKKSKKKRR